MKLLFVCLGNICRSPLAEGVTGQLARQRGLQVDVDSAGTGDWHAGEPPDRRSIQVAAQAGIDISRQRARQVTPEDFRRFDHIFAMDSHNLRDLGKIRPVSASASLRLFLALGPGGDVPDPYYGGPEDFAACLTLVRQGAEAVLDHLSASGYRSKMS
jgi:protein-tyrosine phosphatase